MVEDAMAGRIQLAPFVTHTMGLTDINRAFDLMHAGESIRSVVHYAALPALDAVFLALGTTIQIAGSQARFRAVDFDANLAAARMAQAAGARRAALVSAMGANARSRVFYSRVKGELEEALAALGLDALVIARPSMLRGDRAQLGQPVRAGELRWARLDAWLRPLIPANYRAIDAADVAAALRRQLPTAQGRVVLPSGAMQGASQTV
jgi:uncharacterized protein YbjT (DUF2867 family)